VDCGAIPGHLLESELFGFVKGAFTGAAADRKGLFQEADKGTLFLDEIANLPLEMQSKLMRVLQEGEVRPLGSNKARKIDVRIISASISSIKELE
jgi:transcriptional regulator with PAS, ATPase and Fis domain